MKTTDDQPKRQHGCLVLVKLGVVAIWRDQQISSKSMAAKSFSSGIRGYHAILNGS
jgi:hypothetical protein